MGGDFTGHAYATRSQGPPIYGMDPSNMAPSVHKCLDKAGCLAAKLIDDMCSRPMPVPLECDPDASHTLRMIPTQSRPDDMGLMVCICERCKRTFTFDVSAPNNRCPQGRMHHFVINETVTEPSDSTIYPVIATVSFMCSATDCSLAVNIEVCAPRFSREWDSKLLDRNIVAERLKVLLTNDSRRFEELTHEDKQTRLIPAFYLNAYIRDALLKEPTRVSVRNKFYSALFTEGFDALFDLMGFEKIKIEDELYMRLPSVDPPPPSPCPTPYSSRRARLEVIRAHLLCLLVHEDARPRRESGKLTQWLALLEQVQRGPDGINLPLAAETTARLTRMLDAEYTPTTFPNWKDYPEGAYDILGANRDMPESLLWHAAVSQNQTDPSGRELVYQSMMTVTKNRENRCDKIREYIEEEGMFVALEQSKKEALPDTPLSMAFRLFGLPHDCVDAAVLYKFTSTKAAWNQPTQRTARHSLYLIARARQAWELMHAVATFDTPQEAADFLGVEIFTSPGFAVSQIVAYNKEAWFDKVVVAAAARMLANAHIDHPERDELLSYASQLESESGDSHLVGLQMQTAAATTGLGGAGKADMSLPAGLQNIRNTCYLNSILQYFNTVLPVRNVILDWERYKLAPTEENIRSRLLAGSGSRMTKGEAFLAAKFVEEMRSLFSELQSSNGNFVRPKQRLVLAALNDPDRLVKGHAAAKAKVAKAQPFVGPQKPPELPPRDSSTGPTVSVKPLADSTDTGSDASSETLVDQKDGGDSTYLETSNAIPSAIPAKSRSALEDEDKDKADEDEPALGGKFATRENDEDVKMPDANEIADNTAEVDPRTDEEKIQDALNDETITGSDQQDIEEIMGSILSHLHGAVASSGTDEHTGTQTDIITETFYWSSKRSLGYLDPKTGQLTRPQHSAKPESERWVTAFPADEGKVDLYSALDRNFDREHQVHSSNASLLQETYVSITKAPPILHVYIQRSQNVNGQLKRNDNIVEIPETLYLDRYMDADGDSDIVRKRQRSWNLKGRLQTLKSPPATVLPNNQAKGQVKDSPEADYEIIDGHIDAFADAILAMDTGEGDGQDEYVSILDADTRKMLDKNELQRLIQIGDTDASMSASQQAALVDLDFTASKRAHAKVAEETAQVQEELSTLFSDMKRVPYRLHAVICHGGGLGGGHYWVWIYDFQKNVWRKYNDETVTEHMDSAEVLAALNDSSTPYYLAYVRENEIDTVVAVAERTTVLQVQPDIGSNHNGAGQSGAGGVSQPHPAVGQPSPQGHPAEDAMQVDGGAVVDVMHVEDRND
ncbi:unnamed protein product [Discula destructiva]